MRRHAHTKQHPGLERLLAVFATLSMLAGLMVSYAPTALAHHPDITAYQTCIDKVSYIHFDAISWKTDGTSGSGHPDIRIEVQVNGSGSWNEVTNGAFTSGNTYRFSGDFSAAPYWGDSIQVRAHAVGPWDNGTAGGQTTEANAFVVSQDCFNPGCPAEYYEYKVEPVTAGTHGTYFTISNITDSGSGPTFDWSSTLPVYQVIVKGGPGAILYDYSGASSDTGLHAPLNSKNDKWFGLSHVTFCFGDPVTQPVTVVPSAQVCQLVQGVPQGGVSFNIDPAAGASVQVYSDSNLTSPLGGQLGDGQLLGLSPGTYYWKATSSSGYELSGQGSGEFTVLPCAASVVVTHGDCVLDSQGGPAGEVQVVIDPDSGATVVVSGPGGPYNFSGTGGTETLAPGDYSWVATAGAGFALDGVSSGEFTVLPCAASVVVTHGDCVLDSQGGPAGEVQVVIDPDSGATVVVSGPGGPYNFSGTGGTETLAPGDYSWVATAGAGFALDGVSSGEFTVLPCAASVVVTHGDCVLDSQGGPAGEVQVVIDPDSGATVVVSGPGGPYNFSGTGGTETLAPGDYSWFATPGSGFTITSETSGEFAIVPCEASVIVTLGQCELLDGPLAPVSVYISAESGATVTIFDGDDQMVATLDATGVAELPPGDYTWSAEPGDGFQFPDSQEASGSFMIAPCVATVLVSHGNCVVGAATIFASVDVSILPDSAALVSVNEVGGGMVALFGGAGGTDSLAPGDYQWVAKASPGFVIQGNTSGEFTVASCPDVVEAVEIDPTDSLPFTGMDSEMLFGASVLMLGMGLTLVRYARRRGQD